MARAASVVVVVVVFVVAVAVAIAIAVAVAVATIVAIVAAYHPSGAWRRRRWRSCDVTRGGARGGRC